MDDKKIEEICAAIGKDPRFRTFGGGVVDTDNLIAHALKNEPLQFFAGVNVKDVVTFVLARA